MILIGQYDSPFVRRVAIALRVYGFDYQHQPWSTFSDGGEVARFNPLRRVPTLALDDGEVLIESAAILDYLDERAGAERAMIAERGPERRRALKVCALGTGFAEKGVSLFYEKILHRETSDTWVRRCEGQIADVLAALEEDRAARTTPFWFGAEIGHADVAVACALRFVREAHPHLFEPELRPKLAAHSERCEALDAFRAVVQPLSAPRG